jgi:hypothetical protein
MLDQLRRPISMTAFAIGAGATAFLVAAYCLAYTALAGRPESLGQALGWAIANVCPWLIAIEAGKRAPGGRDAAVFLAGALTFSLMLGYALDVSEGPIGFEALRRLPALGLSAAAILLLRSRLGRPAGTGSAFPLLPRQIDWVRAAGNYIELRAGGRTIVHRSSIAAAEHDLARHGFVRIHRSTLVRRDRIARVRPEDVVMVDGTHLKVGKRYRTSLQ